MYICINYCGCCFYKFIAMRVLNGIKHHRCICRVTEIFANHLKELLFTVDITILPHRLIMLRIAKVNAYDNSYKYNPIFFWMDIIEMPHWAEIKVDCLTRPAPTGLFSWTRNSYNQLFKTWRRNFATGKLIEIRDGQLGYIQIKTLAASHTNKWDAKR